MGKSPAFLHAHLLFKALGVLWFLLCIANLHLVSHSQHAGRIIQNHPPPKLSSWNLRMMSFQDRDLFQESIYIYIYISIFSGGHQTFVFVGFCKIQRISWVGPLPSNSDHPGILKKNLGSGSPGSTNLRLDATWEGGTSQQNRGIFVRALKVDTIFVSDML